MPAENSVTAPAGVIRPIRPARSYSVNQRLPSGPAAIPAGPLFGVMPAENSVTTPAGVIRPIRFPLYSVNQRLPSGPAAIPAGPLPAVMPAENSVIVTACAGPAAPSSASTIASTSAPSCRRRGDGRPGAPAMRSCAALPTSDGPPARPLKRHERTPAVNPGAANAQVSQSAAAMSVGSLVKLSISLPQNSRSMARPSPWALRVSVPSSP